MGVRRVSNVCGHIYTLVRLPGLYPCWEWVGVRRVCDVCGHMYIVHPCETTRLLLYPSWVMSGCKESVQCVWAYLHPCETDRLIPLMGGGGSERV